MCMERRITTIRHSLLDILASRYLLPMNIVSPLSLSKAPNRKKLPEGTWALHTTLKSSTHYGTNFITAQCCVSVRSASTICYHNQLLSWCHRVSYGRTKYLVNVWVPFSRWLKLKIVFPEPTCSILAHLSTFHQHLPASPLPTFSKFWIHAYLCPPYLQPHPRINSILSHYSTLVLVVQ